MSLLAAATKSGTAGITKVTRIFLWQKKCFRYKCRMPAEPMSVEGEESGLRHQLSAGQMAMVAVGGSIGTGLLLGSAAALEIAGPG